MLLLLVALIGSGGLCCHSRIVFATRVILDQLLQLFQIVYHVDSFAPIKARWLQNPHILTMKVTEGHYEAARARRETLYLTVKVVLNVQAQAFVPHLETLFR